MPEKFSQLHFLCVVQIMARLNIDFLQEICYFRKEVLLENDAVRKILDIDLSKNYLIIG